jgi:uncharacterized damage-inducible protein DinB
VRAMAQTTGRPESDEFAPHAKAYVDLIEGKDAIQTLAGQIQKTIALLEPLPDDYASGFTYAPGKWTVKQIVGHLSDAERVFAYRALHLARHDATPLASFEQDDYVAHSGANLRSLRSLLDEFKAVRESSLTLFRSLPEEAWLIRGLVSNWNLTLRGILFTVAGHELHHYRILQKHYIPGNAAKQTFTS